VGGLIDETGGAAIGGQVCHQTVGVALWQLA
jgi:hypothetical protein